MQKGGRFNCGLHDNGSPRIEPQRLDNLASYKPLFKGNDDA
jgi:hypothetical protein